MKFAKALAMSLGGLSYLSAQAALPFAYQTRTQAFSGWNTAVRGDINTVGMAGATVAIPYSIAAAEFNPAGFAMSISSLAAQLSSASIHDGNIQKSGSSYQMNEWGIALSPPPWGFGISYYSPNSESGSYISPKTGHELLSEVSTRELRFTLARAFLENRFSVGWSVQMRRGIRKLGSMSESGNNWGMQAGALYRLDDHVVMGASLLPNSTIDGSSNPAVDGEIDNFFQRIESPTVISAGIGWIPNRFFKAGFSLQYIGTTSGALLADESKLVGLHAAWEPRLGASYVLAEYQNFKMECAMGTYYEPTRITGENSRMHGTLGIEFNPYFINTGVGFDVAQDYRNVMVSLGIDIVRTLRTFDIVPKDPTPAFNGFIPKPLVVSADGLPAGMIQGEYQKNAPASLGDVGQIIKNIPDLIQARINPDSAPPAEDPELRRVYRKKKRKLRDYPHGRNSGGVFLGE